LGIRLYSCTVQEWSDSEQLVRADAQYEYGTAMSAKDQNQMYGSGR